MGIYNDLFCHLQPLHITIALCEGIRENEMLENTKFIDIRSEVTACAGGQSLAFSFIDALINAARFE